MYDRVIHPAKSQAVALLGEFSINGSQGQGMRDGTAGLAVQCKLSSAKGLHGPTGIADPPSTLMQCQDC